MNCETVKDKLTLYLLGDLDKKTAAEVRKHLKTCEACRALAADIEPTLDLLQDALAAPFEAPEHLSDAAREQVLHVEADGEETHATPEPQKLQWLWTHHPRWAFAASLVIVLGAFFALVTPRNGRSGTSIDWTYGRPIRSVAQF